MFACGEDSGVGKSLLDLKDVNSLHPHGRQDASLLINLGRESFSRAARACVSGKLIFPLTTMHLKLRALSAA